jgi:hypothetical protein
MKNAKRSSFYLVSFCCALLFTCGAPKDSKDTDSGFSFSASTGVKLDINTGTKSSYSGFSVDEIYLVDVNDKQLGSNEVALETKFSIVYEGVENYTLKDGKAFPGLSMVVTDAAGNFILNEADLFGGSTEGYSAEDASVLRGTVTVGDPMKSGETYHCKIRVFDKNSDAEIVSELDFTVK